MLPIASYYYDGRFAVPAVGVLAAAAGVGAFGVARKLAPLAARRLPAVRERELV